MSLFKTTKATSYSFKSSGTTISGLSSQIQPEVKKPPIGIKTPLRIVNGSGLFDMHTDITKVISDNLRNLILTNHGERLGFPDFGANLLPLVFELGNEDGDAIAISQIRTTVGKYMPYISLEGFQTFIDPLDANTIAKVGIQITYTIPAIDNILRSLEVMLYTGG